MLKQAKAMTCPQCGQFRTDHDDNACSFKYGQVTDKWSPDEFRWNEEDESRWSRWEGEEWE